MSTGRTKESSGSLRRRKSKGMKQKGHLLADTHIYWWVSVCWIIFLKCLLLNSTSSISCGINFLELIFFFFSQYLLGTSYLCRYFFLPYIGQYILYKMVSKQKPFEFSWINIRLEEQLKNISSTDLENSFSHRQMQCIQGYNIYVSFFKTQGELLWMKKEDVCWAQEQRTWSSARLLLFLTTTAQRTEFEKCLSSLAIDSLSLSQRSMS